MGWQRTEFERIAATLPDAAVRPHGSVVHPDATDGWSDLDLQLATDGPIPADVIAAGAGLWAYEDVRTPTRETCRMVLRDGRRIDLSLSGSGRIDGLHPAPDNDFRFIAAMAATKIGRGDLLIGGHLTLELIRSCLVVAMQLRDRDLGTAIHRTGSDRDRYAARAMKLATVPLTATPRPNVVEQAARLYSDWRLELDPAYRSDWSPLDSLIERGIGQ
jgi:hypothetical protein